MKVYSGENSREDINADRRRVRVVSPARESDTDRQIRKLEEYVKRQGNSRIKTGRIQTAGPAGR